MSLTISILLVSQRPDCNPAPSPLPSYWQKSWDTYSRWAHRGRLRSSPAPASRIRVPLGNAARRVANQFWRLASFVRPMSIMANHTTHTVLGERNLGSHVPDKPESNHNHIVDWLKAFHRARSRVHRLAPGPESTRTPSATNRQTS